MKSLVWVLAFSIFLLVALRLSTKTRSIAPYDVIQATVGDVVCRTDHKLWAPPGATAIIMVTSPTCGACEASKSFDEELYTYGHAHGQLVYYVLPKSPSSDQGALELTASGRPVLREDLSTF